MGFLNSFKWSLAPTNEQGLTWLELMILFFKHGGNSFQLGLKVKGPAETGHSIRVTLAAFCRITKQVIQVYMEPVARNFFKPSKFPKLRRRPIGYTNHLACIAGLPHLSTAQAEHLTTQLIGMRTKLTSKSLDSLQQGLSCNLPHAK